MSRESERATNGSPREPVSARPAVAAFVSGVLLLALGACGADEVPLQEPGPEVAGGAVGPDVRLNEDLGLHQVQLEYPLDGVYEDGEDARLFMAISNTGPEPAVLVDVEGPDFADVRVTGVDGGSGLPLAVDANDNLYIGAEGPPIVELVDVDGPLRSSESIPVTFTFDEAGSVTVDVVVSAEGQSPSPPYDFPSDDGEQDPTT